MSHKVDGMGSIDQAIRANDYFALTYSHRFMSSEPWRKLAVVACMDVRTPVETMLGLRIGDAHIIRNAGGIVTDDTLRSLLVSHHLKGVEEIMIINHTDCGMMRANDEEIRAIIGAKTGRTAAVPERFHTFTDLEENVRAQVRKVRTHPWFADDFPVRGFVL